MMPAVGARHGEVAQLHLLLLHLRLQRLAGLASAVRSAVSACSSSCRLIAPALNSSLARCCLLPREVDVGLARGALGLLARHRRLLAARIDLHQRRARAGRGRRTSRRSA